MDGTLTPSRQQISHDMLNRLTDLRIAPIRKIGMEADYNDIIIVSGASMEQIRNQIGGGPFSFLSQNGNVAESGRLLWENKIPWDLKYWVLRWIYASLEYSCEHREWLTWPITNLEDLVEDRGCQVSYSLIGHHADLELKRAFDPDGTKRKEMLRDLPWMEKRIEVGIGGSTCLDFYLAGKNKGTNIAAFIERMGWDKEECLYLGDQLFEGGNDHTVVGVIPTQQVSGPDETLDVIKSLI